MDIIKCFISECALKPQGFCDCLGYPELFCEKHCYNHLQNIKEKPHELQDLWHFPHDDTRKAIINEANKLKRDIRDSRKYLISEFNSIFQSLVCYKNQSFSILTSLEKKANQFIKAASYIKEVPTYPKVKDYQLLLRLKPIEARYRARTWRIANDWIKTKSILDSIEESFELFRINPFKEICHYYAYSESIFYFCGWSKELKEFNFVKKIYRSHNLDLRENIWSNISMCPLPNNRIFCYGNWVNNSISGLAFIIEKDKTINMLPEGKAGCDSGSILYNNHIYSFGGISGVSEKFCLKKNIWKSCCQLPKGNYQYSTSTIFGDTVLLSSLNSTILLKYDIKRNIFITLPEPALAGNIHKRIFTWNSRAYIIETSQKIYESAEFDPTIWREIGRNFIRNFYIFSFGVYQDNNLWLINSETELIKFNFQTKELKFQLKI